LKISTKELVLVTMFAALTAIGAFIRIPIPYVPFTLQFLFCAFSGILLGSRLGALSQIIYLFIGLMGIPVFTQGGGPGYIFKPTFGYLLGFIIGAYVIGRLTERIKKLTLGRAFSSIVAGMLFIYLIGVPYLYMIYNLYIGSPKSFKWAMVYGFLPFIGGDILLSFLIAIVSVKIIPILRKAKLIDFSNR